MGTYPLVNDVWRTVPPVRFPQGLLGAVCGQEADPSGADASGLSAGYDRRDARFVPFSRRSRVLRRERPLPALSDARGPGDRRSSAATDAPWVFALCRSGWRARDCVTVSLTVRSAGGFAVILGVARSWVIAHTWVGQGRYWATAVTAVSF
jgi:hypothetical protein